MENETASSGENTDMFFTFMEFINNCYDILCYSCLAVSYIQFVIRQMHLIKYNNSWNV